MKKAIGSIVAFAFAAAALAGVNLFKNGDFESGKADGWSDWGSGGKSRIEETSPHGGRYCFAFEHRANQKGGWRTHRVAAKPSSVYTVSGHVRGDAGVLQVKVFFSDAKGKYISETMIFSSASAPEWMHFEKALKTPDNAANITLGFHVAEGIGCIDDLSVVEGNCVKSVVNEIRNSSFAHSLHESGLPTYWSSGGSYSFRTFKPGVHEGRYFRIAPEEKSPVPGTKVMFVDDVSWSVFMTGPLVGDKDYVFSVYMRSDKDDAKVKLGTLSGRNITPGEKEFTLTKEWQRLVMPFRLKNTATPAFYAAIKYQKNAVFMAAPMLHIGREAVQWQPNPADANLPDLRKGRPAEAAAQGGSREPRQCQKAKDLPQENKAVPPRIAAERDLYAAGEDVVRIRTFDVKEPVTVKLIDESGKVLFSRVEHVDRVDIADLPNGYYRIVVEAANGKAETHFRKNVAAKSYSRVNRFTKNIEVDGRPFFPMVYTWLSRRTDMPTEWHISELKKRNFNTILFTMETFGSRFGYTPDDRRRLLRIFADAGFRFILWTNADIKKSGTFAVAEAHRKYLGELGAELLDRVVGWYYLDEIAPVYWETHFNVRESDIAPGYRADKAVDPDRLHFINWNQSNVTEGQKFFAENGATDLYSLDSYPYGGSVNYGALAAFERAANAIGCRIDDASLPGIMWLQTYSFYEGLREPMPVEYRNNVYIGLVNHVSGFMNFIGCPENGDLWDEMGRAYGTALKWLEMTVQPGAKRLMKGKVGNIAYALWERGDGGHALVAVNTTYSHQKETIQFGVEFGKSLELVGGEGNLAIGKGGTLTISLPVAGSAAWFIGE